MLSLLMLVNAQAPRKVSKKRITKEKYNKNILLGCCRVVIVVVVAIVVVARPQQSNNKNNKRFANNGKA